MLSTLEAGAVQGSEIFGSFEYYTSKILEQRMIKINNPNAYNRLVAHVGDAAIQIKREQIAAMSGKTATVRSCLNHYRLFVSTMAPNMSVANYLSVIAADSPVGQRMEWAEKWASTSNISSPTLTYVNKRCRAAGNPQQNAYIERYNRTVRQEWLNQNIFETIVPLGE